MNNEPFLKYRKISLKENTFCKSDIELMSTLHHFTIMSLQQAKKSDHEVVTQYLTYLTLSQTVSGKLPM